MLTNLLLVALGMFLAFLWRFVRERGHAVFGVQDDQVQDVMKRVIRRYTTLSPLNMIDSGPTHQQVFRGGTVIAWFDPVPEIAGLPKNVRSYVVWGKERRKKAAIDLVNSLWQLGFTSMIHQPLTDFPPGTFLMVTSNAFIDSAHAFRPHWIKMVLLEMMAKKK